jgi:helicase
MKFHGLFIGIDRYKSSRIGWLDCALRDASAIHALFTDNLSGDTVLLKDQEATREEVTNQLKKLQSAVEEDVVLIYFSGHGSETHELVTYDADVADLENTAFPLSTLFEQFQQIPSRQLICILDCCFSGGMGAKVLHVNHRSRSLESAEVILEKMSGNGRLIITASSASQPAWETTRMGHGFLTYHLLEGLKGAEEVVDAGKISIFRLLDYVTKKVAAAAASIGKEQHPNVRGTFDEAFSWPVFSIGPKYLEAFPELARESVTEDLESLKSYGFDDAIIASWAQSIPKLNELQIAAVNQYGILQGQHLVVSAPTSSGKTMVGELAAINGLVQRRRAIFLFPLKALVNDKYKHFTNVYGTFGYRTIRATGDLSDQVPLLIKGQYDICLMTYEKFTALVLANPHILEHVGTVVIDEVQMIAEKSRGANLEFILTLLRMRRRQGIEPQLIALSAVIGDTNGLERWLDAALLKKTERPVPLDEGIITGLGGLKYLKSDDGSIEELPGYVTRVLRKGGSQEFVIPLVRKLVNEGKQVIVFREQTGQARGAGKYLAESLGLPPAAETLNRLPSTDLSNAAEDLRIALNGGVAIHISHLSPDERLIIEEQFRKPDSEIRVISATTTLAMGINTPAEAVVVVGLQHPGGPENEYTVAEYKNMIGRAGRLGFADRGQSFLLSLSHKEEFDNWNRFVLGSPEDLESKFLSDTTDPRSLIVKVLVSAKRFSGSNNQAAGLAAEDLVAFLEGSFGAFRQQFQDQSWKWNREDILRALSDLVSHGLIERTIENLYSLTPLGWIAGHSGIEVESVIRIADALRPLSPEQITDPTLIAICQLTLELENVHFPFNKIGVRKEIQSWSSELYAQGIASHVMSLLQRLGPDDYVRGLRLKRGAACLLWITKTPMSEIEITMTRHGRKDGAAGQVRGASSRTHDVIHIVGEIASHLHPELKLGDRMEKLYTRLELGIPSSITSVAKVTGSRLTRGDYLSLVGSGLDTKAIIEGAPDEELLACLGGNNEKLNVIREAIATLNTNTDINESFPTIPIYEP